MLIKGNINPKLQAIDRNILRLIKNEILDIVVKQRKTNKKLLKVPGTTSQTFIRQKTQVIFNCI